MCLEKISADTNKGEVQHRSLPFSSSSIFAVFQSSSRKRFSVRRVWCRNKERISYKFRDKRKVGLLLNWKEELRSKILLPSIHIENILFPKIKCTRSNDQHQWYQVNINILTSVEEWSFVIFLGERMCDSFNF